MSKLLEVEQLKKSYEHFKLKEISFSLEPGYIMGFVGPNGAGKTTVLQLILNSITRDAGKIKVFGKDNQLAEKEIKEQLGIVLDNNCFVKEWKIQDIEKVYKLFYKHWDSKKYADYLKEFHLLPSMKVKDLSRGMAVKLMVATALAHDAKLLLLDEPTSGLDPEARAELMEIFQSYIEDGTKSILFSTHVTSDLEKIADYITCIDKGEVYYTGTMENLFDTYRIVKGGPNTYKGKESFLIGIRKFTTGFEGLILTKDSIHFKADFLIEVPTIDDIIIFKSRGGKKNER